MFRFGVMLQCRLPCGSLVPRCAISTEVTAPLSIGRVETVNECVSLECFIASDLAWCQITACLT